MNPSSNNNVTYGQSDNEQTQANNIEIKSRDDNQREILNRFVRVSPLQVKRI